ncbi:MAG: choice-of-anchor A family protein [Saprospiraceae bacterium]|nr:choice-of-anchor A family protein [Saprospiraceae bacterium]
MSQGNFTFNGGSHIHGPLAVGGNLVVNGSPSFKMDPVGPYTFPGDPGPVGLMVKGGITWQSGIPVVLTNGYIHIGSSTGSTSGDNGNNSATRVYPSGSNYNGAMRIDGTIDQTPSPAVFQSVTYDFDGKFNSMVNTSNSLAACTNNVQLYNSSNGAAITGNNVTSSTMVKITSLSSSAVNYLDLTTTSLNNISELKFEGVTPSNKTFSNYSSSHSQF